ncbi:MAG: hypothetical protein ACHQ5A_06060 [Opitutales bacterium]
MRLFCVWFALGFGLWAAVPVGAREREPFPGAAGKWRRYQSPHFELFSQGSDFESRELLSNLELLRALFFGFFKFVEKQTAEVTVYYFNHEGDFDAYKTDTFRRNDNIASVYQADPDRSILMMAPFPTFEAAQKLAFKSYVHHLFRLTGERPVPWFGYGVSELFATMEIRSKEIIFGQPDPGVVQELRRERLMPLEALLAVDAGSSLFNDSDHSRLFYAQAWALVHYWWLGDSGLSREQLGRFEQYASQTQGAYNASLTRAKFQEAAGLDYPEMNRRLDSYMNSGRYRMAKLPLPQIEPSGSYARSQLSRDEITERLAELALRTNRSAYAKLTLLDVLNRRPDDIRTLEALGAEALRDNEPEQAAARWEHAFSAGSRNPAVCQHLANIACQGWFRQFDLYFRLQSATAEHLRALLLRSIECAPAQSTAYENLAWVESAAPQPSIANVNLVQRHFAALDDKPRTLLALALVRLRMNDRDECAKLVSVLEQMHPTGAISWDAEVLRAYLEGRPPVQKAVRQVEPAPVTETIRLDPPH